MTTTTTIPVEKDLTGARAVDRALALLSMVGRHAERGVARTAPLLYLIVCYFFLFGGRARRSIRQYRACMEADYP